MKSYVYSVYPESLAKINSPLGDFVIPACKDKRGVASLSVDDVVRAVYYGTQTIEGSPVYTDTMTRSEDIARWLAEEFHVCGVFTSADTPSDSEVANARHRAVAFLQREYDIADRLYNKTKDRMAISDIARLAAGYFGRAPEWSREQDLSIEVPCPVCKLKVQSDALKCRHCSSILDQVGYDNYSKALVASTVPAKKA